MEKTMKKDKIYYENMYIALLKKLKSAKNEEEFNTYLAELAEFEKNGYVQSASYEDMIAYQNGVHYKNFVESNENQMLEVQNKERTADKEIRRIKFKKFVRTTIKVAGVAALVILIGAGVHSCNKKKGNNGTSETSGTSETTTDMTTTGETTINTIQSTFGNEFDNDNAIPSLSESMDGIVIIDPTQTSGVNNGGNGNSGNSGSGYSDDYIQPTDSVTWTVPTDPTTKPTEETTKPTEGTTTTTPTTRDENVPTTEPVQTKNTEPSNERDLRDVEVDVHDGKNPEYIEEDPNETYETYIYIPSSSTYTVDSATTTTTDSLDGMPIEEDPNETYETYFKASAKKLTRK